MFMLGERAGTNRYSANLDFEFESAAMHQQSTYIMSAWVRYRTKIYRGDKSSEMRMRDGYIETYENEVAVLKTLLPNDAVSSQYSYCFRICVEFQGRKKNVIVNNRDYFHM